MSDGAEFYPTECGRKLCVILRDHPHVHIQPIRDAFRRDMQFEVEVRNVGAGETGRDMQAYFSEFARKSEYAAHSCLFVFMVGCYKSKNGWGINVSGVDVDFGDLMLPFVNSETWFGKPKVFIVQYQNESRTSTVCCDAAPLNTAASRGGSLPAFHDTAVVLGYGGDEYITRVCNLMSENATRLEFNDIMQLVNGRPRTVQNLLDEAPNAPGCYSQLTKQLWLAKTF